jgi:hypothetical protein
MVRRSKRKRSTISEFIEDHFTCSICFEVMDNPIRVCQNEHYNCAKCINTLLLQSALQYYLGSDQLPFVEYAPVSVPCPACRADVTIEDLLGYDSRLVYAQLPGALTPKKCDYCELVLSGQHRAKHALICADQTITCTFCQETCTVSTINHHLRQCQSLPVVPDEETSPSVWEDALRFLT